MIFIFIGCGNSQEPNKSNGVDKNNISNTGKADNNSTNNNSDNNITDSNTTDTNTTHPAPNHAPIINNTFSKISFEDRVASDSIDTASSVFVVDINKDGKLDILTTSEDEKRVVWLENLGNFNYNEHNISTNLDGARSVLGIDFDKDGDIDILATAWRDNKVIWFENSGNQNFAFHVIDDSSQGAFSLKVKDIDKDGDLDIVVASYDDNSVSLYKNNDLNFTKIVIDNSVKYASSVEIYDIDRDGYEDLVASSAGLGDLYWYKQDSSGVFSKNTVYDNQDGTNSIFINQDGIYSTNYNSQNIVFSKFDGSNFTNQVLVSLNQPESIQVKDMDGDGDDDIVVGSFSSSSVVWYEKSENTYIKHKIDGYGGVNDIKVIDIDGDGDSDIVASQQEDSKVKIYNNKKSIYVYENNQSVMQINANDSEGDTLTYSLSGEDADDFDINSSGYISFKNIPDFEAPTDSDKNNIYNITVTVSDNNLSTIKDFRVVVKNLTRFQKNLIKENINEINDIAVQDKNITVVSSNDPMLFTIKEDKTIVDINNTLTNPISVGYLNNDIVVGDENSIFLYGADYSEKVIDDDCGYISDLVVSDIDDDEKLDFASTCYDDEKIKWYIQQSDGNFSISSFDLGTDNYPWAITVSGENHKNFIVALPDSDEIVYLENNGSENFSSKVLDYEATNLYDVSGSFAVYDNKLSYYYDNNKTILNTPKNSALFNSLAVGDIDGDGDKDIATVGEDGSIFWFENLGNNSYKQNLVAEVKNPIKVVIGDYDGDEVNDLIVATNTKVLFFKNMVTESLF